MAKDGASSFDPDRVMRAAPGPARFTLQTGVRTRVVLASGAGALGWDRARVAAGGYGTLWGSTQWVGDGAAGYVVLFGTTGRCLGARVPVRVSGDTFRVEVCVPPEAKGPLLARLVLPEHGLEAAAPPLEVVPAVAVRAVGWNREQARRGEVVSVHARVEGAPEGCPARVRIFRYDAGAAAHELQAEFHAQVADGGVRALWRASPGVQPHALATQDELDRRTQATGVNHGRYAWPASFCEVECLGVRASSLEDAYGTVVRRRAGRGLLRHCDWVELRLQDGLGGPATGATYTVRLADGSERHGTLDERGLAREEGVPPGRCRVTYRRDGRAQSVRVVP